MALLSNSSISIIFMVVLQVVLALTMPLNHTNSSRAGSARELYINATSNLKNSSYLPKGSRWSSITNQNQLHFFCERLAMYDAYSQLYSLTSSESADYNKTVINLNYFNVSLTSTCHLWVS